MMRRRQSTRVSHQLDKCLVQNILVATKDLSQQTSVARFAREAENERYWDMLAPGYCSEHGICLLTRTLTTQADAFLF